MKIVVLTNGSLHGLEILKQLDQNQIEINCIIKERKMLTKKELSILKAKLGIASPLIHLIPFKNTLYKLFRKIKYNDIATSGLKKYSPKFHEVNNFNNSTSEKLLRELGPDLIILGGSRIIKENILSIPKKGTLNAHPGRLPYYRGLDVIKWALYNGDKVGVTVHFVSAGIDTGPICAQTDLRIEPGSSIEKIKYAAIKVAGELMAKTVKKIISNEHLELIENDVVIGNYYKKMSAIENKELLNKLAKHG